MEANTDELPPTMQRTILALKQRQFFDRHLHELTEDSFEAARFILNMALPNEQLRRHECPEDAGKPLCDEQAKQLCALFDTITYEEYQTEMAAKNYTIEKISA